MKKLLFTVLFILGVCTELNAQQLNTPLLISGKVYNSAGELIKKEALRFRVFTEENPDIYLNQDDASCGYQPPLWFAELGNLQTLWGFGDNLIILIEDIENRENIRFSWIIDSTARIPGIQTQPIYQSDLITHFRLSDKGVFHNQPVKFSFRSVFSELPAVELKIYTAAGQQVFRSANPESVDFELFQFSWDGKNSKGQQLISGMYYYVFKVDGKLFHSGIITLKNE